MSVKINAGLVRRLIASQFSEWKSFTVQPVKNSGWDNRTFRLGSDMLVRIPSAVEYAEQVEKEHQWLPKLASFLPLQIPTPLAMGKPISEYPWKWSVYKWIEGDPASSAKIHDLSELAACLAKFLTALQDIDSTDGPPPGPHNFYRGGGLKVYDEQTRRAIDILKNKIDVNAATQVWEAAIATTWEGNPVWVHGDISAGNLLVKDGKLAAVIDFGMIAVGDPACDLAIAWTFFDQGAREIFQRKLFLDHDTWLRGRAWALWKALIVAADLIQAPVLQKEQCWSVIHEILTDFEGKYDS